jgi:hypothetical protein
MEATFEKTVIPRLSRHSSASLLSVAHSAISLILANGRSDLPKSKAGRARARCRRKSSVCEVPFRKVSFESRVPIRSDEFGEKVQQNPDFRCQAGWAKEKRA